MLQTIRAQGHEVTELGRHSRDPSPPPPTPVPIWGGWPWPGESELLLSLHFFSPAPQVKTGLSLQGQMGPCQGESPCHP